MNGLPHTDFIRHGASEKAYTRQYLRQFSTAVLRHSLRAEQTGRADRNAIYGELLRRKRKVAFDCPDCRVGFKETAGQRAYWLIPCNAHAEPRRD